MQARELLLAKYPDEIVGHILGSYNEVERYFQLSQWKTSELDAGHFVESVRRLIESVLFGCFTPFSKGLDSFNQSVLAKYESAVGHESFRILIPRVLYGVYCIRNKRGVGHVAEVSPNEMDATYILYAVKWVLAELVRLASEFSPKDAERIVSETVERQVESIWDDGESFMVLDTRLSALDKVLVVLYRRNNLVDQELQALVEYQNSSRFRKLLQSLKQERVIDYLPDGRCKLSPLGVIKVESLLMKTAVRR